MAEADRPITETGTPVALDAAEDAPPRRKGRLVLMLIVPLAILLAGGWFWLTDGRSVSTDNAYVKQDVVSVASEITGRIVKVGVRENQIVKAGDLLFRIDPQPYKVALAQADAQIASAQVKVTELQTDYATSGVNIAGSQSDVTFARAEYQRQKDLMDKGFSTKAKLQAAQNALQNAEWHVREAQVDEAKAKAALATGSQVPGVNPAVAAALAQRAKAALDLSRTEVRAPTNGRITQTSSLLIGQMMFPGLTAVSLVASDRIWIEANFKETQLAKMRPGQSATIRFDAFPDIRLKGHVESLGAGTGSEFSVLPAQNANGNWVKVTQRVPVRIAIDDKSARPLIAGLSAEVTVDVREGAK
jgi:membrane fusion protein (multidrug efflux system)